MNSTVEANKIYEVKYTGRSGKVITERYLVTEVRSDGTIVGARWIKTTQKFSGESYILWHNWDNFPTKQPWGGVEVA